MGVLCQGPGGAEGGRGLPRGGGPPGWLGGPSRKGCLGSDAPPQPSAGGSWVKGSQESFCSGPPRESNRGDSSPQRLQVGASPRCGPPGRPVCLALAHSGQCWGNRAPSTLCYRGSRQEQSEETGSNDKKVPPRESPCRQLSPRLPLQGPGPTRNSCNAHLRPRG